MRLRQFDREAAKRGEPVYTREGIPVRVLAVDIKSIRCIAGAIAMDDDGLEKGLEKVLTWLGDGSYNCTFPSNQDLFMAPKKVTRWINWYPSDLDTAGGQPTCHFPSKEIADTWDANNNRAACKRIACTPVEITIP